MEQNNYTVYLHISPSGKRYYGITCQKPSKRWNNGKGYIGNKYFYHAIEKYGWENIEHTIIASDLSKEDACALEESFISVYDTTNPQFGYNISAGGEANRLAESTKQKLRESKLGKVASEETKRKLSESHKGKHYNVGRVMDEDWCRKISESLMGRKPSEKSIQKARERLIGNKYNLGVKRTEESKRASVINNENTRKITCDNIVFDCIGDCADYLEINKSKLKSMLRGDEQMSKELVDRRLHYADCDILYEERPLLRSKNVECDGVLFSSVSKCAKFYGVDNTTMSKWLNGNNPMPKEFVDKNLHYVQVITYWAIN